jgi:2-amino-4-hydroxy-6-hydroxymethyldihydropteridine diphosphokinase
MGHATVYLGLGSNLGDRQNVIEQAVDLLSAEARIEQVSSIYETAPVGYQRQPSFLNAVAMANTPLDPEEMLRLAKRIEAHLGRTPTFRNGPRVIDIDLLLYNNQIIDTPQLTLPHPRLAERAFVLCPLSELAPDLVHPVIGRTIASLLNSIDHSDVRKWETTA